MRLPRGSRGDSGYILLGIVIALVVLGIFLVAAVPLWQKVMQREREKELIFRGYQYMRAIELYQKKYPGAFPPNLEALVEEKFLRKVYDDPMTGREFNVLRQLSPELQFGGPQALMQGQSSGITSLNRSRAELRTPGGQRLPSTGTNRQAAGGRASTTGGRGGFGDASLGGIVGVASTSAEKTFYQVPGKEKYKDWLFVWSAAPQGGAPGQAGQPGQPTMPGVPGQSGQSGQPLPTPGLPGASANPGLPPPPYLTSIGLGIVPGAPNPLAPGQQTGMESGSQGPGTGRQQSPGFSNQPSFGMRQQQRPRRQPDP